MVKKGRPRIISELGSKKRHCINCYDFEWQKIWIYFEKLKRERKKYEMKEVK